MVRCKVVCQEKQVSSDGESVSLTFYPVVDGSAENKEFFKYTPAGSIQFSTINKAASDRFEQGAQYYMDFTAAR